MYRCVAAVKPCSIRQFATIHYTSVLIALMLSAAPAVAQVEEAAQSEDAKQTDDHFVLGAGAAYGPAYQGADDYRLQPFPVLDIKYGPFFANLRNGIGVAVVDGEALTIGGGVVFLPGYRRKDAPAGIGKLSDGIGGRVFANVRAAGFVATIGAIKGISGGTEGFTADASLSYPIEVAPRFTLTPTVAASWADDKHNDRYFGVNAAQSLASGLPQFRPGSGFKDVSGALSANYRLSDRIGLGVTGSVTTLLGTVKDSPIVVDKTQPAVFVSLSYRL